MRNSMIIGLIGTILLAACGGDQITGQTTSTTTTTTGTTTGTGTTTPAVTASSLSVSSSNSNIAADGSTTATITAIAKDANNNVLSGATIAFKASAGSLAVTQATTDATGQALATLSAGGAAVGTPITVTVSSGTATANVAVNVVNIQQSITLTTNAPQIPSDGSKAATITAYVRDANNNFVPGVAVNFITTSGGLVITRGTTDATGSAVATLTPAGDPTNRLITVTATAGSATATVPVSVVGTSLSVTGPSSLVLSSTGTYTVALTDASGAGIANQTVTLASSLKNTLSSPTVVTDATGQKTFTVTAVNAGTDSISGTALGITAGQTTGISAQNFAFSTPAATGTTTQVDLAPTAQTLTVTWTVNNAPQTNQVINFASTRGTLSAASATTNASGQASVTISSTVAGPATVTASATGVTTQASLNFLATVPASIDLQASPATIPTQGQSTLIAIVRDASNNLVQGQTVTFQTVGDVTGGTLSVASALTDSQGRAQTVYTASATPSATNGVTVQATVQGTTIAQTANLTVGGRTVFLSLGTGNKVMENATFTQFLVPFTVEAVDAAGNPVANVPVTLTVHPVEYFKGGYYLGTNPAQWDLTGTPNTTTSEANATAITACPNEDANFNGVLDPGEDGQPADVGLATYNPYGNNNGVLDPGGVAVASPASLTTGADGSASFNVIYPEDHAIWVTVQLIATATVAGTETTATATFQLPILATYITTTTSNPPGYRSPYGIATSCTNPN